MDFTPWGYKQQRVIFSEKPITLAGFGIQAGKTTAGSIRTKIYMCRYIDPTDAFLVIAPTYKILQQSTLPSFLQVMDGLGEYHKGDSVFKMYKGGTCYIRSLSDPNSIVGITNVRHVWGDEAGLFSLYGFENIQARAAFKNAPILLTTSPYALNWIYKDIIRPKLKDPSARPDVELIQARSDENPYFPKDVYESRKKTMDPRRFNSIFGGQWEKMEGLVYDCFDEGKHVVKPFPLPQGTKFYAGVDWGFTNPFALVVRAITPEGNHIDVSEVYETGLTISDMVARAKQKKAIWGIECFYCDPSAPAYIEEFNRQGLRAMPANNDIRKGIDLQYELIKDLRWFCFSDCKYLIDEMESYHYPDLKELKGDTNVKEQLPVKQNDHLMDASRYISIALYRPKAKRKEILNPNFVDKSKLFKESEVNHHVKQSSYSPFTEDWSR